MSILQCTDCLIEFFNNIHLNLYNGNEVIDLMDLFPRVKQGIVAVPTVNCLRNLHQSFQKIISSEESTNEFNNAIVGTVLVDINEVRNLINIPNCNFSEECISEGNFAIYLSSILPKIQNTNRNLYYLIKQLNNISWWEIENNLLRKHSKINNLYLNIILEKSINVNLHLRTDDPRANNFQAYKLALSTNNRTIIKLVRNNSILRNFLQKEVLLQFISSNNLIRDLLLFMITLL